MRIIRVLIYEGSQEELEKHFSQCYMPLHGVSPHTLPVRITSGSIQGANLMNTLIDEAYLNIDRPEKAGE